MPIAGKAIPLGDDPVVDHDAVVPASFGSTPATGFGGTTNATASGSTGGFGSSSGFGGGSSGSSSSGFGAATPSFGAAAPSFGSGTTNVNVSSGPQPVLTGAGSNAAQGADVLVANTNEDWINKKWRPVMGWMYMLVCTCDFVVFPILWSLLQAMSHGQVTSQWQPVTLQGAGLFHISMGAVLGIAAYGRTKEKLDQKQ